jgi:GNAT superfamily N-acetyltransferase
MTIEVVPLEPRYLDALADLFRACECPCFCRYWHFEGDKNAWLERCATTPQVNEAELRADVVRGEARSAGLLAFGSGADAVGYMKLAPRAALPKLRGRSVYRAHDLGPDEGVLSIGCLLVHPAARRRGVARALVTHALHFARERGACAIEAYPHRAAGLGAHEMWTGPCDMLVSLGFRHVAGDDPYPVLRFTI